MEVSRGFKGRELEIVDLFTATFTASEGADEGTLIGNLVHELLDTTAERDLFVFTAEEAGTIVGAIVFSRLTYDQDDRTVFVLAPVAVATDRQGRGIGQRLLADGLAALRETGVDIAVTYGDPGYYSRSASRRLHGSVRPGALQTEASRRLARAVADRSGDDVAEGSLALRRGAERSRVLVTVMAIDPIDHVGTACPTVADA
jgi:putative acetyltransferase